MKEIVLHYHKKDRFYKGTFYDAGEGEGVGCDPPSNTSNGVSWSGPKGRGRGSQLGNKNCKIAFLEGREG